MRKIRIKLAGILEKRSISQAQLSRLSKVRPNAISNLCRGYVDRLSIEQLEKIAHALELESISELIELENEEK